MSMLFSAAKVASLDLKNRVVMSPMRTYSVQKGDGVLNPLHFAHYGARAVEQVGLVILEMTAVEPEGRTTEHDLGLWNDEQAEELKRLVDFLHSLGTKVGIELGHAGRKAKAEPVPVAPSLVEAYSDDYNEPKALSVAEIKRIQKAFVTVAKRAIQAGVDLIELQGAEGFLIDEFFSPVINRRDDEYGGELAGRYRFVQEIIAQIRDFYAGPLWVRLSLDDYAKEDEQNKLTEWQTIGQWLERDGVDCLSIMTGGLFDKKPDHIYEGWQVPYATAMKRAVNLPIAVTGMLLDSKLCEYILETKQADLILEAHVFDTNARWVVEAKKELHEK